MNTITTVTKQGAKIKRTYVPPKHNDWWNKNNEYLCLIHRVNDSVKTLYYDVIDTNNRIRTYTLHI